MRENEEGAKARACKDMSSSLPRTERPKKQILGRNQLSEYFLARDIGSIQACVSECILLKHGLVNAAWLS